MFSLTLTCSDFSMPPTGSEPGLTPCRHGWVRRDRQLSTFVEELRPCPVTQQMFDEVAFLREPDLATFLVELVASLHEYDLVLERSLIRGVKVDVGRPRRSRSRTNQTPGRAS